MGLGRDYWTSLCPFPMCPHQINLFSLLSIKLVSFIGLRGLEAEPALCFQGPARL